MTDHNKAAGILTELSKSNCIDHDIGYIDTVSTDLSRLDALRDGKTVIALSGAPAEAFGSIQQFIDAFTGDPNILHMNKCDELSRICCSSDLLEQSTPLKEQSQFGRFFTPTASVYSRKSKTKSRKKKSRKTHRKKK